MRVIVEKTDIDSLAKELYELVSLYEQWRKVAGGDTLSFIQKFPHLSKHINTVFSKSPEIQRITEAKRTGG